MPPCHYLSYCTTLHILIPYDDTSALTEFKVERADIRMFPSYGRFCKTFPQIIRVDDTKENLYCGKYYCYYSEAQRKIVILEFDANKEPFSFYFVRKDELKSNVEYSMSNVFYWEKIFESFSRDISDKTESDNSFYIHSFDKGLCKFVYSEYDARFDGKSLKPLYEKLIRTTELTRLYPLLLKNRCCERLDQLGESTLAELIAELDEICNKTEVDFNIYISKIDFDSYVKAYKDKISTQRCGGYGREHE